MLICLDRKTYYVIGCRRSDDWGCALTPVALESFAVIWSQCALTSPCWSSCVCRPMQLITLPNTYSCARISFYMWTLLDVCICIDISMICCMCLLKWRWSCSTAHENDQENGLFKVLHAKHTIMTMRHFPHEFFLLVWESHWSMQPCYICYSSYKILQQTCGYRSLAFPFAQKCANAWSSLNKQ